MWISVIRWLTFAIVFVIQAGAFFEKAWITWIAGALFCLFLTVSHTQLAKRTGVKYGYLYLSGGVIFLVASYVDMRYFA